MTNSFVVLPRAKRFSIFRSWLR